MIISIASGKGGTGKTTVATNLAMAIGSDVQLLDCDVEEPNSHLFINPVFEKTITVTTPVPEVDKKKCNLCGKCDEICQFKAIIVIANITVMTFPELCHSCGGCEKVCPENAIKETTRELGIIQTGYRNGIEFVHGKLRVGEAMSPPLIVKVRSFAKPDKFTIIDAPPGTSCPVIASMKNTDFILLVTEPTPFGLHDLKLAISAVKILKIPCGLVINRSDVGDNKVKEFAKKESIPVLLEIPFDRNIAEVYSRGDMIVEKLPGFKEKFLTLYDNIKKIVS
ncbi:MAG: ATP-binding protein [Proteobacteria bacterium]|nr:(4Fe-4S)-binding protein [Desulfobacteraceae bacterium]MBU3979803.1 ATP-binding protein [Pseudomonadota bacterium]MBU4014375.1 ATP-binding protein [Pseudomonadota bacterium]MBU4068435.1 ATP-binding protein [Pseudomonadota bacterium]MBU4100306.1 ATP-binding protein [Pseudomonadota bacterium]